LNFFRNFSGLLLDGLNKNEAMNLHNHFLNSSNIINLFHKYNVPADVDYISIDIDSADIFMLEAILKDTYYQPKVISIEYNCYFPWNSTLANYGYNINDPKDMYVSNYISVGSRFHGTSLKNVFLLAHKYKYSVVAVDIGVDIFLIRNDVLHPHTTVFPMSHYKRSVSNFYAPSTNYNAIMMKSESPLTSTQHQYLIKKRSHSPMNCWCMGPRQKLKDVNHAIPYLLDFEVYLNNNGDIHKASENNYVLNEFKKYDINTTQICIERDEVIHSKQSISYSKLLSMLSDTRLFIRNNVTYSINQFKEEKKRLKSVHEEKKDPVGRGGSPQLQHHLTSSLSSKQKIMNGEE